MTPGRKYKAPRHLAPPTRRWVEQIAGDYVLESHHLRLLLLAGESWDRVTQARETVKAEGLTIDGRFGKKLHPAVLVEKDNKVLFARLLRELGLDSETPDEARPPRVRGGH